MDEQNTALKNIHADSSSLSLKKEPSKLLCRSTQNHVSRQALAYAYVKEVIGKGNKPRICQVKKGNYKFLDPHTAGETVDLSSNQVRSAINSKKELVTYKALH